MFGLGGSQPIAEYEAADEIERVYHEIRQTLRVSGVNLNFRTWAGQDALLPVLWDALKANAGTMTFEHAADQLRIQASRFASESGRLNAKLQAKLGESQAFQVRGTLLLYHYVNPKLLLITSAIRLALQGDSRSGGEECPPAAHDRIKIGIPPAMLPMEMEDEMPEDEQLKAVFADIKETLSLKSINSDYRTLALWPDYLDAVWRRLKPHVGTTQYVAAVDRLREQSQSLAARLPYKVLIANKRRTLVPDLLGFGFSDRRDCFDRSIGRQAEMIDAWMEKLQIERAAIVAHDIGGGVALRLATLFPHRVSRLCVMNTVCYDSWPIELMLQFGHPEAQRKVSASTAMSTLRLALKSGFSSSPDDELMSGLLAPYRTEVGKLSLIRNAAALNTNLTTEITHLLPTIVAPTLILWGEDDTFQLVKYGERLAADIPCSQLIRIADARHFAMIDQPESVCKHLLAFLE